MSPGDSMNEIHILLNHKPTINIRKLAIVILHMLAFFFAGYLIIAIYVVIRMTYPTRAFNQETPQTYGMQYDEIVFPARVDGVRIAGWYIPADDLQAVEETPVIVMVHGRNSSRTICYNQHFLDLASVLHHKGYNLLMMDLRGHGRSAISPTSYGIYERRDVLGAVDYLLAHGHQPGKIGLLGTSLGAAAVVGAAVEEPAIGAVVTDSLYADTYPLLQNYLVKKGNLPEFLIQPMIWLYRGLNGYDPNASHPINEISRIAPRALLMIHCLADNEVPVEHFYRLKQAAPTAQTWLVQGCQHADIYEFVPQEYGRRLIAFYYTNLH